MDERDVVRMICREAKEADDKARAACVRSKYSIQDYWLCIEFVLQRLADRVARESGLAMRCPHYPFRQRIERLRKEVKAVVEPSEEDEWDAVQDDFIEPGAPGYPEPQEDEIDG